MHAPATTLVPGVDRPVSTTSPFEWHDEATIAVNPADPSNVIAASAKFVLEPTNRSLSVFHSQDGGVSWRESELPLLEGQTTAGGDLRNPVLDFGADGAAYLFVEGYGDHILRSEDGGATWKGRKIAAGSLLILPLFACDPTTPGRMFVTTSGFLPDNDAALLVSEDYGRTWRKTYLPPAPVNPALAPRIVVDAQGSIHILSFVGRPSEVVHWRSDDGGQTFTTRPLTTPLYWGLAGGWRVSACVVDERRVVVAWAAVRNGVSRIYYRVTDESGEQWLGPLGGTPLVTEPPGSIATNCFRPQLRATGRGVVGCAFYALREASGIQRAELMLAPSYTSGEDFEPPLAISDTSWEPATGAASGLSRDDQFGYFGLAADESSFLVLWPDTRTGAQTLYFDRAQVEWGPPPFLPSDHFTFHFRLDTHGGGWIVVVKRGGKVIFTGPVRGPGPHGPSRTAPDLVRAFGAIAASGARDSGERGRDTDFTQTLGHAMQDVGAALLEAAALHGQHGKSEQR